MPNTKSPIPKTEYKMPPTNKYQLQGTKTKHGTRIPTKTNTKYQNQIPPKQLPKTITKYQPSPTQPEPIQPEPGQAKPIQLTPAQLNPSPPDQIQPSPIKPNPMQLWARHQTPSPRKATQTSRSQPPQAHASQAKLVEVSPKTAPSQPQMG